jgi:FHA domain-containing protein
LGTYIPDDFNPLAFGGVSQRNAEDPLSPLGLGARGMEDVLPTKTIDSIYAPNDSAADELVVDPLDLLGDAFLNVGGTLDPMELFAADSGALGSLDQPSAARSSRAVDNAPEMKSYFRAPIAVSLAAEEGRVAPVIDVSSAAVQALANPIADDAHDAHDASGGVLQTLDAAQEIATPMSAPPAEKDETNESGKEDDSHESQALRHLSDTGSGIVPSMESSVGRTLSSKQVEVPAVDASETKDLLFAFKRGAGLLDSQCPVSLTPEVMEKIGEMLKLAVQGSMDLLNARAVVKQEVKLSVTLINPDANNPLKFLPNSAVALTQMFGPRMPGFMSATEAMGDAYDDLVAHQTAMAAGTQAAVEAIFNRFDPDALEAKREKRGVAEKLLPNAWKSQLWDAYRAQFDNLRDDIKGDFFNRLGAEFQEAYETEHEKSRTNSRG